MNGPMPPFGLIGGNIAYLILLLVSAIGYFGFGWRDEDVIIALVGGIVGSIVFGGLNALWVILHLRKVQRGS